MLNDTKSQPSSTTTSDLFEKSSPVYPLPKYQADNKTPNIPTHGAKDACWPETSIACSALESVPETTKWRVRVTFGTQGTDKCFYVLIGYYSDEYLAKFAFDLAIAYLHIIYNRRRIFKLLDGRRDKKKIQWLMTYVRKHFVAKNPYDHLDERTALFHEKNVRQAYADYLQRGYLEQALNGTDQAVPGQPLVIETAAAAPVVLTKTIDPTLLAQVLMEFDVDTQRYVLQYLLQFVPPDVIDQLRAQSVADYESACDRLKTRDLHPEVFKKIERIDAAIQRKLGDFS